MTRTLLRVVALPPPRLRRRRRLPHPAAAPPPLAAHNDSRQRNPNNGGPPAPGPDIYQQLQQQQQQQHIPLHATYANHSSLYDHLSHQTLNTLELLLLFSLAHERAGFAMHMFGMSCQVE
ncbi:hypothetical protein JR316_0007591 [Psilocybe cubensis]|uniref:Uncharacterized protein n=1 Tax=Psilocybe cubensis TaxID=181762 RepID=A0ACB8GUA6_PSICU|nr:hypothetical protein JR316_0007591 [Psilocybe cubensis]KAH9479017.1 hypothetical protein JR316_0007591 [Psilocybe cubensis]